jgi:hypothetical protein
MPPGVAVRGTAPRGASSDGLPAPRRLEQPLPGRHRSLTSVRRRAGTASSVPSPTGSLRDVCLAARASRFTRSTETASPSPLAETMDRPSWTPSTVPRPDFGFPRRSAAPALWLENRRCTRTVFTSKPPLRASAPRAECSSASVSAFDLPCGVPSGGTRDASDRFLPIHFFVPAPAPRRFPAASVRFRALRSRRDRLLHGRATRFGGPHVVLMFSTAAGVVFPPWCVRTEPLTPLSPPPGIP